MTHPNTAELRLLGDFKSCQDQPEKDPREKQCLTGRKRVSGERQRKAHDRRGLLDGVMSVVVVQQQLQSRYMVDGDQAWFPSSRTEPRGIRQDPFGR